jgi:hypothetical protein
VPQAAAGQLLKTLNLQGVLACFVAPDQAAQLRVALDGSMGQQAILALVPEAAALTFMLCCDDFTEDLGARRLWFATGDRWADMLGELFQRHPGLPLPGQFIRTMVPPETLAEQLIGQAQAVFSAETGRRQALSNSARASWRGAEPDRPPRLCVVSPGRFRLWEGAGRVLGEVAEGAFERVRRYDPDLPTSASPLGFALAAAEADVLLMADKARSDLTDLLPAGVRCVTWCTTAAISAATGSMPHDRLLIADTAWKPAALRKGWLDGQITVAQWPSSLSLPPLPPLPGAAASDAGPPAATLAILADTVAVQAEPEMDLSSHRLLWQAIAAELRQDPFALGEDPARYLHQRRERMNIDERGFDTARFLNALVIPAYQQSLARVLLEAGVPVKLHGAGWDRIGEFPAQAAGPLPSRQALLDAAAGASALVHVWPDRSAHEIDSLGRPVVRPPGRRRESFLRAAKSALTTPAPATPPPSPLDGELLRRIVSPRNG